VSEHDVLLEKRDGGIVELRLNRPDKLNALNDALFERLVTATEALHRDPSVRVVIITGEGRAFCAGLDLATFRTFAAEAEAGERPFGTPGEAGSGRRQPGRGQRVVRALRTMPVPVIAAINGAAIGGGCQLVLGADIRLVAPDAKLAVRETDYGITPDMGGTQILPRLVGSDHALELIATGRIVSGTEAVSIGLATKVCDEPLPDAWVLAREIASRNPDAMAGTKALIRIAEDATIEEGFAAELDFMSRNIGHRNQVEAATARLDKRAAVFEDPSLEMPRVP
jgi:enoyl-CoA hydratase/carnithine racemase